MIRDLSILLFDLSDRAHKRSPLNLRSMRLAKLDKRAIKGCTIPCVRSGSQALFRDKRRRSSRNLRTNYAFRLIFNKQWYTGTRMASHKAGK